MDKIRNHTLKYVMAIALALKSISVSAFGLQPIYPFVQVAENGLVSCKSIPYAPYDVDPSLGQTLVFSGKKLLYIIDKYFYKPFLTTDSGRFLIEFNFKIYYRPTAIYVEKDGSSRQEKPDLNGKAINIYKDGILFKSILFSELGIDTSKIDYKHSGNWFTWNFKASDTNRNEIKVKMESIPFFCEDKKLYVIASDEQLIEIDLLKGRVVSKKNAYEALAKLNKWSSGLKSRRYEKVKYPGEFYLPKLNNGKSIEKTLAKFLNKSVAKDDKNSAIYQIYFHTLIINKNGRCEDVYVSTEKRSDLLKSFSHNSDNTLKSEIESWIKDQVFDTRSFPKGYLKYKYSDFLYFK